MTEELKPTVPEGELERLERRYKVLVERQSRALQDKARIEATLEGEKKRLRESIAACKAAGFNPDTLEEDIRKAKEVVAVKLDAFEADLDAAESIMAPLLKEIGHEVRL